MTRSSETAAAGTPTAPMVRVWDPFVRSAHWTLVLCVGLAWLTREGPPRVHDLAGHAALAVVAVRILWGFVGPPHARFADFVRGPRATLRYARALLAGREPRFLGHNPLGGWMILALLSTVVATGLSGWLLTTDAFWGSQAMEALHDATADLLLLLIAGHVAGVVFTSRRHGENLVVAMITGRKRP